MSKFKISIISTEPGSLFGDKLLIEEKEARYIRETSTGYALIDGRNAIVYTVPAGLIVEEIDKGV